MKKNVVYRKSIMYLNKIPRFWNRLLNNTDNYILVNSFPKSGTHLLYQIFSNQPFLNDYKVFIASMPSISKKSLNDNLLINKISNITNNEVVRSHVYYSNKVAKKIDNSNCIHFFIYRDPRDVVISESNYLFDMNKWHRLHKFFRKFDNLNDRISFSIAGNDYFETGIEYPDINKRFNNYKGWLNSKTCFCIKYEDLIANQSKSIELIADHMISNYKGYINKKEFIENALLNINPNKSHTFRDGGINKWKNFFNDKHKKLFKKYTRDLLIELGYEKDYDW